MKYLELCGLYERLEKTAKRLEKTALIAQFLKKTPEKELEMVVLLLQGRVFPPWDPRELGLAAKLVAKTLASAYGVSLPAIEKEWSGEGDLGLVAQKLSKSKPQKTLFSEELSVPKVFETLRKIASSEGKGAVDRKTGYLGNLLSSAEPVEAKYVVRTALQELRVGTGAGTMRDAIVWAFLPPVAGIMQLCQQCGSWMPAIEKCVNCNFPLAQLSLDDYRAMKNIRVFSPQKREDVLWMDTKGVDAIVPGDTVSEREIYAALTSVVEEAYALSNDYAEVALKAKSGGIRGLRKISLKVGKPIKVMLAQKVKDVKEGFERLGRPLQAEYKYDGFRMQIHKKEQEIIIFTRRLENVTAQFPDVVEAVRKGVRGESFILDGEAVGIDPQTGKYRPFQEISQRIKRKYSINVLLEKLPVELNLFDVMHYNEKSMLKTPFKERRALLQRIVNEQPKRLVLARALVSSKEEEVEAFYKQALEAGNEGLMLKKLDAPYKPGLRVGFMVKLKPVMDTLDVVVVGAEWGEGKRAKWLTSFKIAVMDENGDYVEVGKVGTGIKELEGEGVTFSQLTEMMKPLIVSQKGREVELTPKVVMEVSFEEIQRSPTYRSGFALRFPRVVSLREDRSPEDVATISQLEEMYRKQRQQH